MGRFRFLDDVAIADCAMEVEGADLPDLFETAARALAEVMVDPATVAPTVERQVALTASSLDLLMHDWLSELIYLKDRDREIFTEVAARVEGAGPYSLLALMKGGVIDPERTDLRADAKAVTFHQFALERSAGGWRARVIIDI